MRSVNRNRPKGVVSDGVAKEIIRRLGFGETTAIGTILPVLRVETHQGEWVEHHDVAVEREHIAIAQRMLRWMGSNVKIAKA